MALLIRRLDKDDQREHFDCLDENLNNYLRRFAWQNQIRHSVGVTYVAVDESQPRLVIGYYTLAMSSLPKADLPEKLGRHLPPGIPVLLLARLGVDQHFQGRGIGEALLVHAMQLSLSLRNRAGCRLLLVEAYRDAVAWYQRYGFLPISSPTGGPMKMFIDLRTVEMAERGGEKDSQV